jgi:hypothetical protein
MGRMQKTKKSNEAKAKSKQAKALKSMKSDEAYRGTGTSKATQNKIKSAQDRKDAYASMASAGIKSLSGATTGDEAGEKARQKIKKAGYTPIRDMEGKFTIGAGDTPSLPSGNTPPEDKEDEKEEEKKDKALETAKELTDWWKKNNKGGYRAYGDRTTLGGKVRNSQEAVTAKIQDKLNKGYYKIVNGPQGQPLIIHASTGTPVNPYTGGIISTQAQGDQGGAYQNEMAKITGIDPKFAGVFSKEYQTGNGLSVGEMKPEHALRFLMKKNKGAFEQFFSMNKDKAGFNPFSLSFISTGMGAILNKITGPEALQVGNNLERAGWGKAIKGEDGKYTIKLTEKGAENWSNSFNFDTVSWKDKDGKLKSFEGFTSPAAIAKDQKKGYLSEILGTKKYFDPSGVASNQPVDLTNLMEQGGYYQGSEFTGLPLGTVMSPQEEAQLGGSSTMMMPNKNFGALDPYLNPEVPFEPQYGYMPPITAMGSDSPLPGTPPSQYPEFTPGGYKISSYNPTRDYTNQGGGGQGGDVSQSGNQGDDQDATTTQGPLTFDVYGRPITYDYTGGPEQIYLGGGYKRDGQYIGSPYGYSKGGIANFKPYGY